MFQESTFITHVAQNDLPFCAKGCKPITHEEAQNDFQSGEHRIENVPTTNPKREMHGGDHRQRSDGSHRLDAEL